MGSNRGCGQRDNPVEPFGPFVRFSFPQSEVGAIETNQEMTWSDSDHERDNWLLKRGQGRSRETNHCLNPEKSVGVAVGVERSDQIWKYLKIKPTGFTESRKTEVGTGLGNKTKNAAVDMVSVNHLLDMESNSAFHHLYQWSVSTDYGQGSRRYENCRKHVLIDRVLANKTIRMYTYNYNLS